MTQPGTGKTYASAFALREINPKRALFLVHREQIAKQALKSYKKIMNYFSPKFWLGMTASPDTNQYDIYSIFNHQIAYEIRLQQALEEDLLCPFHYFGITELEIDDVVFDDGVGVKNFNRLISDARVDYIIEKANFYGYSGERVKGLVFCSRKDEARELSAKFNQRGFRTEVLTGEDSQEKRERVIERLASDNDTDDKLDYIFTVDIFNEGVDVPEINQIIMLRPTESPVVFVQQLGRGLRKFDEKEYVVILDFIGNYLNNFMIPVALSGDRSYNKDTIRKYVTSGNNIIPGASTIHFDEISKKRIFNSIDDMKGVKDIIKSSYRNLKNRLGRIPYLMDFYENGEVDPMLIISNYKTFNMFLDKMEKDYSMEMFTEKEQITLEYLSKTIASGKRPHELEILNQLTNNEQISKSHIQRSISEKYGFIVNYQEIDNAIDVLEGKFVSKDDELIKYSQMELIDVEKSNESFLKRISSFEEKMKHTEFSKQINDLLKLGLKRYQDIYCDEKNKRGVFVLYEKYSRRDVCLLLNWGKDFSSTMYGMKRVGDDVCIFVTYHKVEAGENEEYVSGKPDYADEFINNQIFMWDSQIGKGPDSQYMRDVCEAKYKHMFVKKSDAEGTDFYYMGQFDIEKVEKSEKKDKSGKMKEIAKVQIKMHDLVRDDLLKYLKSND